MMKFPVKKHIIAFAAAFVLLALLSGCGGAVPEDTAEVTEALQGDVIEVRWQAVEGAQAYRLLRSTGHDAQARFLCDMTETVYADHDIEAGCTYTYTVMVLGARGTSDGKASAALTVPAASAAETSAKVPVRITSVTAMDDHTTVLLLDETESDCEILRCDTADGVYLLAGTTADGVFYDTTGGLGTAYFYKAKRTDDPFDMLSDEAPTGTNPGTVFSLPVFMYHEFVTEEDLADGVAFDEYAVYAEEFESDLRWLSENGYTTVTTAQLDAYLEGSGDFPEKPVMLTIDDGKYGVYKRAWPLLKQYNMTAVLSVIGYRIDLASQAPAAREGSDAPYCTWDEIREMSESGAIEIISHTYDLHIFNHNGRQGASSAEGETAAQFLPAAQKDYVKISKKLREITGVEVPAMAYPYSKRTAESDRAWRQSGYQILLAGDSENVSRSRENHFVYEAGVNSYSSVLRRITRMTGTGIEVYLTDLD